MWRRAAPSAQKFSLSQRQAPPTLSRINPAICASVGWKLVAVNLSDLAGKGATPVAGLRGVEAIAAGDESTCALLYTGTVKCWGQNLHGQLGDGVTSSSVSPVTVANLSDVRLLAAGGYHYCAVRRWLLRVCCY